jgi:hypothetical protein
LACAELVDHVLHILGLGRRCTLVSHTLSVGADLEVLEDPCEEEGCLGNKKVAESKRGALSLALT